MKIYAAWTSLTVYDSLKTNENKSHMYKNVF